MGSRLARASLAVFAAFAVMTVPAISSANTAEDDGRGKPAAAQSGKPSPAATNSPQPHSNADGNDGGANNDGDCGAYCSTRDGDVSKNGKSTQSPGPCAGCEGRADNKYPPGQNRDGADHNNGYECDGNKGIAKTNPAHTGCRLPSPAPCVPTATDPCESPAPCVPTATDPCESPAPCVPTATDPCESPSPCVPTATDPCETPSPCVPTATDPCETPSPCVPTDTDPCETPSPCVPTDTDPCETPSPCVPTDTDPCETPAPCVPTEEDPCVPPVVCPTDGGPCAPSVTATPNPTISPSVRGVKTVRPRANPPGVAGGRLPTTGSNVSVGLLLALGFTLVMGGIGITVSTPARHH